MSHIDSVPVQSRPARVRPVSSRFRHTVHTYHGVDPWDRGGKRMIYMAFDDPAKKHIVLRDEASGEETVIGDTVVSDLHSCAGQRWVLDDRAVLFESGNSEWLLADADPPHRLQPVPFLDGKRVRDAPGHGTAVTTSTPLRQPGPRPVELIDLETGHAETLITVDQARDALPEELRQSSVEYHFNHPVLSPDRSRLFCKLMRDPPTPLAFCAFFTVHVASGRITCHGNRISGHPFWMPDSRRILNIRTDRAATGDPHKDTDVPRRLVTVDADTGEVHRLSDCLIEGPGHPSVSPKSNWIATDIFPFDRADSRVHLLDPDSGSVFEIARLDHRFGGGRDMSAMTRAQPHPAWSPCGRRLLANCNEGGTRLQIYCIEEFT